MQLPPEVIQTDHDLELTATRASGALAKHRWHWTMDESNPGRVSFSEYARQVNRNVAAIHRDAHAHVIASTSGRSPDEARTLARMGAETGAAAEAVAKTRKISTQTVHNKRMSEVRRVRDIARQRAEERGTSVEEEAPKVAETIVRHEQAQQAEADEKAEHTDIRFVEMEGYLVKAKRELLRALKLAPVVPWDDESKELLTETVGNVKALLALIDTALSGVSGVDWDAEFAKVAGDEGR